MSTDVLVEKDLYGHELFSHFKRTNTFKCVFLKDKYVCISNVRTSKGQISNIKYVRISKGEKNLCSGEISPVVSLSSCLYIRFHPSIFHFDNRFTRNI